MDGEPIKATQNIQLECVRVSANASENRIVCKKLPNRVQTHALCAWSASMRLNERPNELTESRRAFGMAVSREGLRKSFSNGLFICDMNCEM